MNSALNWNDLEVGYDIPARVGMRENEVQTPCLVVDLERLSGTSRRWGFCERTRDASPGARKDAQVCGRRVAPREGGACGVCCQKVSEAEVFARGGIKDVLVSNQVRDPAKLAA